MPPPDVRDYIDLRLYDRSAQDVFTLAKALLQTLLPGWVPREGNTEVVLMEALALEVAEAIFAINRLPAQITEGWLALYGVTRDVGAPPISVVTFTLTDTLGHTVPAGTRVRLTPLGQTPVDFTTDADLVVSGGSSTGDREVTATSNTSAVNGTTIGTALRLLDAIGFVDTVTIQTAPSGGRDSETSATYLNRGAARLARLSDALILPLHFTARVLEEADVARAFTIDLYDGAGGPPYTNTGHITVAVRGSTANLSAPRKTELEAMLEEIAVADLDVHVIDPTTTAVNVTATVKALPGYVLADVDTAVTAAVTAYLSADTWPFSVTVRVYELISLMDQVEGVDYVVSVTTPAADVTLTGDAPLATPGTINITVT